MYIIYNEYGAEMATSATEDANFVYIWFDGEIIALISKDTTTSTSPDKTT